MSSRCCNGGRCGGNPFEMSRRGFLRAVAGTTGLILAGSLSGDGEGWGMDRPRLSMPAVGRGRYPLTPPRSFEGEHLQAVAMPIGGIGTGSVWLDGAGKLSVWQIFNNLNEEGVPCSFFAVRAQREGERPVLRVLQTAAEPGFTPVGSLTFEASYPIAHVTFRDGELPVSISMDALNPMIPLDARSSAIPCAIFRVTATNPGTKPVRVSLIGSLQNAVGCEGTGGQQGSKHPGYGRNRNRVTREAGLTAIGMDVESEPPRPGPLLVRNASGRLQPTPELYYGESPEASDDAVSVRQQRDLLEAMARVARDGGVVVVSDARPAFLTALAAAADGTPPDTPALEVFEDFEDGYGRWTVTGDAFGMEPHTGTTPGQQRVSGFMGKGLVNSYRPNDEPQGQMVSQPFRIRRRFIGLLVGGGSHAGKTCVNLRVDGKVVRTATGRDSERLSPVTWDVGDLIGKEATIEIVDRDSGGWGHILVDQITFADAPPDDVLAIRAALRDVGPALGLHLDGAEPMRLPRKMRAQPSDPNSPLNAQNRPWELSAYTATRGLRLAPTAQTLVATDRGEPLVVQTPLGKGRFIMALAPGMPWHWTESLVVNALGAADPSQLRVLPGSPYYGTMALAAFDGRATACAAWSDPSALAAQLLEAGRLSGPASTNPSPAGETWNGAIAVPFTLRPGQSRTVTFAITWHFPVVERFGRFGNRYSVWYKDALDVVRHLARDHQALVARTRAYRDALYQSNLPPEFLDAMASQSVIFRGPTCYWSEDGYFAGFEGSYGCCPLNCTHVWNYAQTHARLFPEIGRNMRESDLLVYLKPTGETQHRQHAPTDAFIDGQCATISATLREHQMSPDDAFLRRVWPKVVLATDWLIGRIDADHDGVPGGRQPNTYDCDVSGANTFIGSQYLCALAAAVRMARTMGDAPAAARWAEILAAGMRNQPARLWNGEYYFQIPDTPPANDYGTGCHSDQLLGQWWAHQVGLGYLYPTDQVHTALASIAKYNYRSSFAGFEQRPRRYAEDTDAGLLTCTWPKGGRPDPFIIYADEVWTGIEYAVAGALLYEGMVEPARKIVASARARYDGRLRPDLNSGPGGNPFNDLECGKFYARAMSSWSLLLACQGVVLDGPAGVIGFRPNWQPEDHRSFFSGPEGWGLFVQKRERGVQTELLEVRHGRLMVREMVFRLPAGARCRSVRVVSGRRSVPCSLRQEADDVVIALEQPLEVREGSSIGVRLSIGVAGTSA